MQKVSEEFLLNLGFRRIEGLAGYYEYYVLGGLTCHDMITGRWSFHGFIISKLKTEVDVYSAISILGLPRKEPYGSS